MGYEEFILSALSRGKPYDQLPVTLHAVISPDEYEQKVKEYWVSRGVEWAGSPAERVCTESEYYDLLVKSYKTWMRVFPHHLAGYVTRVMRVTPFKYYSDLFVAALVSERPYHQLPNFTAADAVQVLGIGRNEYIATLNECKGRRVMWRVNRTAVARELLPTAPLDVRADPWWRVASVNISESEFRELDVDEMAALKSAGLPGAQLCAGDLPPRVLQVLWKKGLIYLEVPVQPTDRYMIPPLEGFVSNKDAAQPLGAKGLQGAAADPLEALLYAIFVANSERLTVLEVAGVLGQSVPDVCTALSVACRLGFATRTDPPSGDGRPGRSISSRGARDGTLGGSVSPPGALGLLISGGDGEEGGGGPAVAEAGGDAQRLAAALMRVSEGGGGGAAEAADPRAVAVVLDAEATSFLMMGALSPGLKRHAVTLFEGGRVSGAATMGEFTAELWASHAEGQAFEGDMARLAEFAGALATVLDVARAAVGPGVAVELLRKESLAGLQPAAAAKVLATAYRALLPVSPLPHPPLPLALNQPAAPAYFGPTAASMSPWTALALYKLSGCGPESLVLCAGQRLWQLPPLLRGATHALVWTWDVEADGARAKAAGLAGQVTDGGPSLVDAPLLLFTINELLTRSAVMVQPIDVSAALLSVVQQQQPQQPARGAAPAADAAVDGDFAALESFLSGGAGRGGARDGDEDAKAGGEDDDEGSPGAPWVLGEVVDIPLPLPLGLVATLEGEPDDEHEPPLEEREIIALRGVCRRTNANMTVPTPGSVVMALHSLGLARAVGALRMVQPPRSAPPHGTGPTTAMDDGGWLPLLVQQGMPMYCLPLCKAVCGQAQAASVLSAEGQARQVGAQHALHAHLDALIDDYGPGPNDLPSTRDTQAKADQLAATGAAGLAVSSRASYRAVPLPAANLVFDGHKLGVCDVSECVQGPGAGFILS